MTDKPKPSMSLLIGFGVLAVLFMGMIVALLVQVSG